tara:strand:+ start:3829 stop:4179 length:351 start_codon:yes stop_codon:yes gene_type:complete
MSLQENIRNIIFYYVKGTYKKYLKDNNLSLIEKEEIKNVVNNLYSDRRKDLENFIKINLKHMMKENYPGDLVVNPVIWDIFDDEDLAKNRVVMEIEMYQNEKLNKRNKSKKSKTII